MGRFRFSAASAVTDGLTDASPAVALSSTSSAPAYNAAGTGRRLAGWRTFGGGPNAVVAASQPELLRRARDLKRNNPHAKRALGLYRTHMVGTGVKPQSLCSDPAVRAAIHALWARWTDFADADGGYDFYGLQAQAAEELATAGEVFARLRPRRMADGLPVPLQVQLLPAEQLPLSHTTTTPGGNEILQGIERDAIGRRAGYWFHRRHPGDPVVSAAGDAWELSRVDSGDVCHLRLADPGQLRGLPWLAPAMTTLKQLADWQDASLHRKQLVTSLVGFVRKAVSGEIDAQKLAEKWSEVREELGDLPAVTLEPGTMQYLDPGEDVEFTNWPETAGADEAFIRASLRSAAAALDVLYEELTGDWSQTNDRTFRAGFATFKRLMRQHQHNLLCFQFNRPVFLRWLDLAIASGALRLPRGMGPADYQAVAWVPERWEYLNPLQDVRAVTAEIDAGLTSRSAAVAERGEDVEVVDAARKGDRERESKMGLAAQSPSAPSPASPPRSSGKPAGRKPTL
ncbi:MAG TPA: phage portal protein, partial [Azospirillaceae bacterium]|nr:phage portal protein [Azospirillaceae bacterium]